VEDSRTFQNLGHHRALLPALMLLTLMFPRGPLDAGEVYKSVDAQGHVVYSDRPDTAAAEKSVVHVDQANPQQAARNAKEQAILDAEEAQRKQQQAKDDAKKAVQDHNRQAQCENARNRYDALKNARRIYNLDADGNRVFDNDADADAKREEARAAMVTACGT
jgi:Domain of unknown function (DUF4124)